MKSVSRFAEYNGWSIDAAPTYLAKQRLFVSSAVVWNLAGQRFVFTDLGNRVYRWQAHERGIEWARRWIDNNDEYSTNIELVASVIRRVVPRAVED